MNPTEIPPAIAALHREYEILTRTKLTLDWCRLDAWRVWLGFRQPPFTVHDLHLVISHLKRTRKPDMIAASLKFHNLIQRVDYFEEDLSVAKAAARPAAPLVAEQITPGTTTRRILPLAPADVGKTVHISEVIKAMRAAVG